MRLKRTKAIGDGPRIESPRELGERYWRELNELVEQGEITHSLARRIMDDMFIDVEPGKPPHLRWRFWRNHVAQVTKDHS
jgi:hypothetical protein